VSNSYRRVAVIGAGHAGGTLAAVLRQYKFDGEIVLIGDEAHPPYQRPPLSKAWLVGDEEARDLYLKPASFYDSHAIRLHLDDPAESIDAAHRVVHTAHGQRVEYDALVFATGARARLLPLHDAKTAGIATLRDMRDAGELKAMAAKARDIVIAGGGYIGLEAAASLVKSGARVTVIERSTRILNRVASEAIASLLQARHEAQGVAFVFDTTIAGIGARQSCIESVELEDGRRIACDLLLVGVGVIPNDAIARAAGVACSEGILVDERSMTNVPGIFAIGDVAVHPASRFGVARRVESVSNAVDQAKQVAAVIAGREPPKLDTPWFWSDQYELKMQMAGIPREGDAALARASADDFAATVLHVRGDLLVGVETVNRPRDFLLARTAINRGQRLDVELFGQDAQPLSAALF
jgi:3-phenylpropionate/trans-cinnamate dioxygenase ferredoxin reductase component